MGCTIKFSEVPNMSFIRPEHLAATAGVPIEIVQRMLKGKPVTQEQAMSVLATLSRITAAKWTLDNVEVTLVPRFAELHTSHNVSTEHLARTAGVLVEIIDRMLRDRPVLQVTAEKVLAAFSDLTGETYTLDNVDVNIYMIAADQSEVARLMQQIEAEHSSALHGLQGLAQGTARHKVITAKQENIAANFTQLSSLIGEEATEQFYMNLGAPDEGQNPAQPN